MRISDWSSDVCSSDLLGQSPLVHSAQASGGRSCPERLTTGLTRHVAAAEPLREEGALRSEFPTACRLLGEIAVSEVGRSEEHTSELQSLMRISYAVFCLKKKTLV